MRLIQRQVEKWLSAVLGAQVTFEKLNLSLLAGSIDATNVVVNAPRAETPLVTVRRVRVEVSLAAAMKKEIVVKSVTIERPVITIIRDADGKLNLPAPSRADKSDASRDATGISSDSDASDDAPKSWKLDAQKVLVVDGEIRFRDASGYHASADQLLAELKAADGGFDLTVMSDFVGRRDVPTAPIGELRLHGRLANMPSLLQWQGAHGGAQFQLGELLRARVQIPSLRPLQLEAKVKGESILSHVTALLPATVKLPPMLLPGSATARLEWNAKMKYSAGDGLRVREVSISAADVHVRV